MGLFDYTIENSTFATAQPWKYGIDYWTSFELYPEWTGKHYYVFKGMAYHQKDYWSGTMVAVKTFRHIEGTTADWLIYKMRSDIARKMANEFNKHLTSITCNTKISFVKPIDATMEHISDVMRITRFLMRYDKKFCSNEVVLFEDLLEGDFTTFVTTQGVTTEFGSEILDAFCHFSYHTSGENLVVCNLKGIKDDGKFMLTNPTIHSRDGCYGDKDKRDVGIRDFFMNHICNAMCETFIKPGEVYEPESPTEQPSAPCRYQYDTSTKALEANENKSNSPPMYTSVDPHGPPPYIATPHLKDS